jgi:hypothetical protein
MIFRKQKMPGREGTKELLPRRVGGFSGGGPIVSNYCTTAIASN